MPARPRRRAETAPAQVPAGPSPYDARPWLAAYPDGVPADFDFPRVPVTRLLDDAAASFPTGVALAFLGARTTYRELREQVDAFASALLGLGVTKGDRVAIILPNCPQNVVAFFGTLRIGAVVVQHNPLYTETELRHQLADCGATVVVCLDRVHATLAKVLPQTAVRHVVVTSLADALPSAARLRLRLPLPSARRTRAELTAPLAKGALVRRWPELLRGAGIRARQVPLDVEEDLALLQYTGGTTGVAQGAMLTHHNLVSNAYMNRLWDVEATAGKETTLAVLPLFHVYGLTVAMLTTVLLSGTLVLLPRFELDRVLDAVDEHRPTLFPGVPPLYKALADSPKLRDHDLRSLRLCLSGAMRLPTDVQQDFEEITGARLVEGYGTTETSPTTHCTPTVGPRRPGSIGLPLPGTSCRVVDPDDPEREVAVGQPGELVVRGPQVFRGWWRRPDQEGVFTADGGLLTGDIAVMDADGWFTLVDRKKELIIAGGFNVYPSEVEAVLTAQPGVAEAVVVGVPDRYRGETVKAYVVRTPGAEVGQEALLAACAEELAAYKLPRLVEFVDALPRSAVGKVLRRVLVDRERIAAGGPAARPASTPGGVRRTADEQLASGPPPAPEEPAAKPKAKAARRAPAETPGPTPAKAQAQAQAQAQAKAQAQATGTTGAKAPGKAPAPRRSPAHPREDGPAAP